MTPTKRHRRTAQALRIATVLATVLALLVVTAPSATAEKTCGWVRSEKDGSMVYKCTGTSHDTDPGQDGTPGGPAEPSCDLVSPATFCVGEQACYYKENVVPFLPPKSEPPKKGADWRVRLCYQALSGSWLGEAVWIDDTEPQPPSLQEQAETAFGRLQVPRATLAFNPTGRTLVSLDTWFWADGLEGGDLTGSSAFGLVAVATPDHLELDPGDGSAPTTCAWVTAKSDACSYAYPRASASNGTTSVEGHGAYAASGQPVWTVHFELNGNPVVIPGAPTELRGPQLDAAVRVVESQALVTHVS